MKTIFAILVLWSCSSFAYEGNGLVCIGRVMYSAEKGFLFEAVSEDDCLQKLKIAMNGFVCDGQTLYGVGQGYVYDFKSAAECKNAVTMSR